jgi:hypothetical protein
MVSVFFSASSRQCGNSPNVCVRCCGVLRMSESGGAIVMRRRYVLWVGEINVRHCGRNV